MNHPEEKKKSKKPSLSTVKYVFKTIIWPRRKLLSLGLVLIIIKSLSGLVLPGSSKYLIDNVITEGNTELLKTILFVAGGAITVQAFTSFFLTRLLSVEAQHLISLLRSKVQRHIIYLPISYFDNTKSGSLVSRIMNDVEGVRNLVGTGLLQLFGGALTSVVAFFLLLNINAAMTLYVLAPLILFGLISLKAFSVIRPIFRKRWEISAEVTGRLTESLGGIRVIKGFNAEKQEISVFEKGVDSIFQNIKKSLTATSLLTSSATLLLGLASVGIMGLGGSMILKGNLTIGEFFAFTLYLGFLIAPIVQMSNIGSQITEGFAGLDRMKEILNTQKEGEEASRTQNLDGFDGAITFEKVSFAYEKGKEVLKDISFEAPAGTVTALVGSSGSGKTTIAGLAASFLKPNQGTVFIDGHNLSNVKLNSYRSQLGVVFQDDFLYEGTIRENILFARPGAGEDELLEAVKAAHVKEFTDRFDDGLDTVIGERGVKLSGGQRQRVTIARALLANPKVLILDEATSSLDTESEIYIQESLARLLKGRTTLVIAHRLSTIRQADQILVIEDGQIVERGTHDELIKKEGRYFRLYTYQARI
ncbi:ABC transporter ATP-binding protein [candidate division KSB1 bacterium]|nr:ABC transporter ATP-binding protein [candidate division KSB1 bacterium]